MARQESDREDLLREAIALVERIELALPDVSEAEHIVIGFRRDGSPSVYFGADPAYHLNSAGELRRAFIDDLLYKADGGALISLDRVRTADEVQLISRTPDATATAALLAYMNDRLLELAAQISSGALVVIGQVPAGADILGRVSRWLSQSGPIGIAQSPHSR